MGDHYGALYLNGGTGKKNILSKDKLLGIVLHSCLLTLFQSIPQYPEVPPNIEAKLIISDIPIVLTY
jgi:hypothetical protein